MAAIVAVGYNWLKTGDGRHAMELFQKADRGKAPGNRGAHGGYGEVKMECIDESCCRVEVSNGWGIFVVAPWTFPAGSVCQTIISVQGVARQLGKGGRVIAGT